MGIFRKNRQRVNNTSNMADFKNPTAFFANTGSTWLALWQEMINGQNESVDIFRNYQSFLANLKKRYENIDFNRVITEDFLNPLVPTSGELMYLLLLDVELDTDIFISTYDNPNNSVHLGGTEASFGIKNLLSENEINFVKELGSYLQQRITSRANATSREIYGIERFKSSLPYNTLELVNYHKYLERDELYLDVNPNRKWNRIKNAPLSASSFQISANNPIILSSLEYTDVPVLDYICYATMTIPTKNFDIVFSVDGGSVIQSLINKYGIGADKFVEKSITELNCLAFRNYARIGYKIE